LDYVFQLWSSGADEINPTLRFLLLSSTSIFLGFLNWLGLHVVGNTLLVIGLLSMGPFLFMILIGAFQVEPRRWLELPSLNEYSPVEEAGDGSKGIFAAMVSGAILWRPFLNSLFWNLNSFDSTAHFAGEVERPGYVLPRSMFLATILIVAGYLLPLLVAIGATSSTPHDWVDGYLATAAKEIGGEWLEAWVVFAAGVSNIALFQAELSADSFQLMGMADRGFVPKIFGIRSRHGTPTYGILLGVTVIVAMGHFNLDKLIELLNFNYAISLLMEYAAFIKLRISKPNGKFVLLAFNYLSKPFHKPYLYVFPFYNREYCSSETNQNCYSSRDDSVRHFLDRPRGSDSCCHVASKLHNNPFQLGSKSVWNIRVLLQ
jgi:amino acid transporter